MAFGGTPYPRRFGGKTTRLSVILAAINRARGSAYNTTDWSSNVYAENAATARVLDLIWSTNGRVANAWDPLRLTAAGTLGRWETILGIVPSIVDTEPTRRARVQAIRTRDGNASALISYATSQLQAVLGSAFVAVETISFANANIHVPSQPPAYPWGGVAAGSPWSSSTAHILVRTTNPFTSQSNGEALFYQTVSKIYPLLDSILPSWVTFDWYRPGPSFTPVTGGPSAGGFYLDDVHNLDNEVFDAAANTNQAVITGLAPNSGSNSGGTSVTLSGYIFTGIQNVYFNGVSATGVTVVNDTTITCTTPAGTIGSATVSVSGSGGYTVQSGAYTFSGASAPVISSLNYSVGDIHGGGQAIVITGTNLSGATNVAIIGGGTTNVTPTSSTSTTCTFTLPAHASGAVTFAVTTSAGTSGTLAFTYWSPLQITGVDSYFDAELGITIGTGVSAWTDQVGTRNLTQGTVGAQPAYTSSAFGALHGLTYTGGTHHLDAASARTFTSGLSWFFVAKTTDGRTVPAYTGDAPNNILGDTGADNGFGINPGQSELHIYSAGWQIFDSTGLSLSDGNPHLFGVVHTIGGSGTFYKGATSAGTFSLTYSTSTQWTTVGGAYNIADGFGGTIGAGILVQGTIAGGDLTSLNAWASQRFGVV